MKNDTWSQYVRMDDPSVDLEAALDCLDWEDDFEIGEPWDDTSEPLQADAE